MNDGPNGYETGGRKLARRPDLKKPNLTKIGDPADQPKRRYGLTRPVNETEYETRQSNAVDQSKGK